MTFSAIILYFEEFGVSTVEVVVITHIIPDRYRYNIEISSKIGTIFEMIIAIMILFQ